MEIKCSFKINSNSNFKYECVVNDVKITERGEVSSFEGFHRFGKSNRDVEILRIENTKVHYLPTGLHKFFPQLERLIAFKCGLKEITSENLLGLDKLELLWICHNNLESLPGDLFIHSGSLKEVNFSDNKLKFMSSQIFEPIAANLKRACFLKNHYIDELLWPGDDDSLESLDELQSIIDSSCAPQALFRKKVKDEFKELWMNKASSDFTIVSGDQEFRVHKKVLAFQSSVFLEKFVNEGKVKATNRLEIKGVSEQLVKEFMLYLYLGLTPHQTESLEFFSLAATFNVRDLKKMYESIAIKNLRTKNALKAFKIGNHHRSKAMVDAAFKILQEVYPSLIVADSLKRKPDKIQKFIEAVGSLVESNDSNNYTLQFWEY